MFAKVEIPDSRILRNHQRDLECVKALRFGILITLRALTSSCNTKY